MNHKHRCPICKKIDVCVSVGKHDEQGVVCEGDYDSPCDRHPIEVIVKWCEEENLV